MTYLPKIIELKAFRSAKQLISGELFIGKLERLKLIVPSSGWNNIHVDIQYGIDEENICVILGTISADLVLICNRCLGLMPYNMHTEFALTPVSSLDYVKNLPSYYEPLLITEGIINIEQMVEDEIILNIPDYPKHANEDCANINLV